MDIIDIKKDTKYLEEYCKLCCLEWGSPKNENEVNSYIQAKIEKILKGDKVISILGLISDNILIGFVSLFRYDGEERKDLTPWYATLYVKKNYRGMEYSKVLNKAVLEEAKKLGYKRVYLKTSLINYYEKFGAKYIEDLNCGEKLYYIDSTNVM